MSIEKIKNKVKSLQDFRLKHPIMTNKEAKQLKEHSKQHKKRLIGVEL